jgi:hypothetical protein
VRFTAAVSRSKDRLVCLVARAAAARRRTTDTLGEEMTITASEALVQLDSLRERLKDASGRLGWLRSYL